MFVLLGVENIVCTCWRTSLMGRGVYLFWVQKFSKLSMVMVLLLWI